MGFTEAKTPLFQAWAQFPDARQHMVDFVDSLQLGLLDALREALREVKPEKPPAALAEIAKREEAERAVAPRLGKVLVGFRASSRRNRGRGLVRGAGGTPASSSNCPSKRGYPYRVAEARGRVAPGGRLRELARPYLTNYLPLTPNVLEDPEPDRTSSLSRGTASA